MATHSSVLAWRIPGTAEPGGLPSVGLHRVRHDWSDLAAAAAAAAACGSVVKSTWQFRRWVQSLGGKDPLEKEMATHSSVHAWRIPGTGEPGGLPSLGSHRVRHDWSNLAAAAAVGGRYGTGVGHEEVFRSDGNVLVYYLISDYMGDYIWKKLSSTPKICALYCM